MTIDEVKKYFVTWYRYEQMTGWSHTNHFHWEKIGYIPILSQNKIEEFTEGELVAKFCDAEPRGAAKRRIIRQKGE